MGKQYVYDIDGYKRRMINPFEPDPVHFNWIDSMVPPSSFEKSGPTLENFVNATLQVAVFRHTANDKGYAIIQFNHDAKQGQIDIEPHVHWSPTDASAGNVVWTLDYSVADIHGVFAAPVQQKLVIPTSEKAWRHEYSEFVHIPFDMTISKVMVLTLTRPASSDADDTYGDGVSLLGFDIHHKVNSFGSRQEAIK